MSLIHKNLTFTIVLVVGFLAFCAGAYLAFAESGKISEVKQRISGAEAQLKNLRFADPAPTEENMAASEANLAELKQELGKVREVLQRGARLSTSTDGIVVMAAIQQYITEYGRKAKQFTHTNADGEALAIELPGDFAFGFEQYMDEATPEDDTDIIATLDKQRQILSYLLNKLYESEPHSLVAVEREIFESVDGGASSGGFVLSDAISARVPGAIKTMGFSLSFTGYTESLRAFLNQLAKFDLPIVVRSIQVERPSGAVTTAAPAKNSLDEIFGVFGGGETGQASQKAQKPVISENVSLFTVVVEFIEVILPADAAGENTLISE